MKTRRLIPLLLVVMVLSATALPVVAQTNFVLHTFASCRLKSGVFTNNEGYNPNGWLTPVGANLYGTAKNGGINGSGTVFAIGTNGGFRLVYAFPTEVADTGNAYGASPNGGLVISNTTLFGTTSAGGNYDNGVIFSVVTNGSGIQVLHHFTELLNTNKLGLLTNSDGASPMAGLVMSGKKLFGTAKYGGTGGNGVIFACSNTTPFIFNVLRHFSAGNINPNIDPPYGVLTNSDGANPSCQLLLLGTNLFGTTSAGGTNGFGTVFRISTNGGGFTVLHHFSASGANPNSGLVFSEGTLYGMGGSVVFSIGTNASGFTNLVTFDDSVDPATASPVSGISISSRILYGAAVIGGAYGSGQIFALGTNGAGFTPFHDFMPLSPLGYPAKAQTNFDGAFPSGGMLLANGILYGAASRGGTNAVGYSSSGVLFRAVPPLPMLSGQPLNRNLHLSFMTFEGQNYILQQNDNLAGTNWVNIIKFPGNGSLIQFIVPISDRGQLFFRLVLSDETPLTPPAFPLTAHFSGGGFHLNFQTLAGLPYTIQQNTNLLNPNWLDLASITGNGMMTEFVVPITNTGQLFIRVRQP